MQGQFVFLSKNAYTAKDGSYRCYASFADSKGNVVNFNASGYQNEFPDPFCVCSVDFDVQQFGNGSSSFILNNLDALNKLVYENVKGVK